MRGSSKSLFQFSSQLLICSWTHWNPIRRHDQSYFITVFWLVTPISRQTSQFAVVTFLNNFLLQSLRRGRFWNTIAERSISDYTQVNQRHRRKSKSSVKDRWGCGRNLIWNRGWLSLTLLADVMFCIHFQIAHFKIPRYIKFTDEFPLTVTGKVIT